MKRTLIQKFYHDISGRYQIVNSLITMGLDKPWRREAAKQASSQDGEKWLDMCCGTGDMSVDLSNLKGQDTILVMADFSPEMLEIAKKKDELKDKDKTLADAFNMPFKDDSFDLVTISFATRNLNLSRKKLIRAFSEFNRILKPGGRLVNIETSQPGSKLIKRMFHFYTKTIITPIGYLFTNDKTSYNFLSSSIKNFYGPKDFNDVLDESGFRKIEFQTLSFGAVSIHQALK